MIVTKDEQGKPYNCSLKDVVDVFGTNNEDKSKNLMSEMAESQSLVAASQKSITEEYRKLEEEFVKQEKMQESLKNFKNQKEKNLQKYGILF